MSFSKWSKIHQWTFKLLSCELILHLHWAEAVTWHNQGYFLGLDKAPRSHTIYYTTVLTACTALFMAINQGKSWTLTLNAQCLHSSCVPSALVQHHSSFSFVEMPICFLYGPSSLYELYDVVLISPHFIRAGCTNTHTHTHIHMSCSLVFVCTIHQSSVIMAL